MISLGWEYEIGEEIRYKEATLRSSYTWYIREMLEAYEIWQEGWDVVIPAGGEDYWVDEWSYDYPFFTFQANFDVYDEKGDKVLSGMVSFYGRVMLEEEVEDLSDVDLDTEIVWLNVGVIDKLVDEVSGEEIKEGFRRKFGNIQNGLKSRMKSRLKEKSRKNVLGWGLQERSIKKLSRKRLQERVQEYIWMRIGDGGDYEQYDRVVEAGSELGIWLEHIDEYKMYRIRRVELGIEIEGVFEGNDYVSLYVGDGDVQPIRELNNREFKKFIEAVRDYVGVQVR